MVNWIVQNNLIKEDLFDDINLYAKALGHNCVGLKIIPFTNSPEFLADIGWAPPEGRLIPYGSTSMIKMFAKSKWNKDGFFFNEENLRTSKWIKELGPRLLNHDAQVMPLSEAIMLKMGGTFFMKPDNDLKDFSGCEVNGDELQKFYDNVSAGGFCFDPSIPVVLCSLKNTGWEYRLFMIRDKIVASSSYKLKSMIRQDKYVPEEVIRFAHETAQIWRPDEVYVMDICETDQGLKVVEFNCFNASGFYNCRRDTVVEAVSEFVAKR